MFGPQYDLELLHQWMDDQGPPTAADARDELALALWIRRLVCRQVNYEWTMQGCSFSQRGTRVLLVTKGTREGLPYVAFTTERDPISCVRAFTRTWLQDRVKWQKDKFR